MLAGATFIWEFDWRWRIHCQSDSLTWLPVGAQGCSSSRGPFCWLLECPHDMVAHFPQNQWSKEPSGGISFYDLFQKSCSITWTPWYLKQIIEADLHSRGKGLVFIFWREECQGICEHILKSPQLLSIKKKIIISNRSYCYVVLYIILETFLVCIDLIFYILFYILIFDIIY